MKGVWGELERCRASGLAPGQRQQASAVQGPSAGRRGWLGEGRPGGRRARGLLGEGLVGALCAQGEL